MKSMIKDIFLTVIFSLPFAFVFALGSIEILKALKNNGFKKSAAKLFTKIKNNKSFLCELLFFIYFFIVLYRTLFQRDFSYDPLSEVFDGWTIFKTQYTGLDYQVIGNVVMFLPFGFLWALCFERKHKYVRALLNSTLSSLAFSAFIEITQLIFSKGTFQFSDIVYNMLGGLLGAVIFVIIKLIISKKRSK